MIARDLGGEERLISIGFYNNCRIPEGSMAVFEQSGFEFEPDLRRLQGGLPIHR